MPRYFLDLHDHRGIHVDDVGQDFDDAAAARDEALKALPELAGASIPRDGDRQTFVAVVKDETGLPIYCATMTYTGAWLLGD